MAAAVDVSYLSASYGLPEPTLQSILSAPTVELVQNLLSQIEAKAREYDELRSEKLRSDVELENEVRSSETRAKAQKVSVDKALKEVEELRQKLSQTENARDGLESELQTLRSSATTSTSEVQTLESRIKTLEAQNRDTIALHESKSAAHDRLAEELSAQHQKFVNLRKQVTELEEKGQSLENAATSAKFREQSLQQEVDMLKKNNEWFETELATRTKDSSKLRKDKNAQISELQRQNGDASATIDSLRRTEASQRQRLEELDHKLEESLLRIQQLQDAATQNEESFRAELDNARRLAGLQQESANTAKAHLQELKTQLSESKDYAAEEVGQLQAEVESERIQREAAETKIAELETQIETLESVVSELRVSAPVPGTPRRPMNGTFDTPGRAGSPSVFSPGRSRGALSTTQLYSENTKLKAEVRALQDRDEKRTSTMNEMLEELESRQPEIEELRQENERLTTETSEISALLEEATSDKETARKETRKYQGDYQGLVRESEILRQQLRDTTAQLNFLLLQQQVQEQGLESLTPEERTYIHQAALGEIPDEMLDDSTDTGRLISRKLVLFQDIGQLQKQNEELLHAIRAVADRYEGSEAQAKANQFEKDQKELVELRQNVKIHEEKIQSLNIQFLAMTKERDMYRRIVTSRGQIPAGSLQTIDGVPPATPSRNSLLPGVEETPRSREVALFEEHIKTLRTDMDALRQESSNTVSHHQRQSEILSKEKNQLQSENMRLNNAVQLAQDRYDLQQNKFSLLQSENNEIKKRCDNLQDHLAKQEKRSQEAVEEVIEAKSMTESLGRENSNLKASQAFLKEKETRLQENIKSLAEDKDNANKRFAEYSRLVNEQQSTDTENRRRLEGRVKALETELGIAQRKLEDELDVHKKATLRREFEESESRRKVDDLMKALNSIRPELASVKTERDQLQARVDELKTEIRIAEERGQSTNARLAPRVNGSTEVHDGEMSREEELSIEILDLKGELEVAKQQLESANNDIENYKAIAQGAEDQLESFQEASENLQAETDRTNAEKDARVRDLEQRVEEISTELATTNTELSEVRRIQEEESVRGTQEKELLQSDITRLKDEADRYKETAALCEEDTKKQAEIATRAQQNYEEELQRHSDALKNLQNEREQHNQLKTEVTQFKVQAEAAKASLLQGEEQWEELRERYEGQIAEARSKQKDLESQNKILHEQFETVSKQINNLRQTRVSVAGGEPSTPRADADVQGLHDLIEFLRRDKDILQVQCDMAGQESKRIQQQLDHTQNQLEQTREKLVQEQQTQAQSKQDARSHETFEHTIEQLNLYRESAATLRNEAKQAQVRLTEKSKEMEELYSQIQPLRVRLQEAEGELSLKNDEIVVLEKDRDHWQKRHGDVLQRYDRIDPAELEGLKTQITTLETERNDVREQLNGFEERLATEKAAAIEETKAEFDSRRQLMITQFKERSRDLSAKAKEKEAIITAVTNERDGLKQQLATLQQELEATQTARDAAIAKAASNVDTAMGEAGEIDENASSLSSEERKALEDRAEDARKKAIEESNRAAAYHIQTQALHSRVQDLENQIGELQQRIAGLNSEVSQAQGQQKSAEERVRELESKVSSAASTAAVEPSEEVEKLKEDLAAAQKEMEDLRTRAEISDSMANASANANAGTGAENGTMADPEQVAQQVATIKADLEAQFKERFDAAEKAAEQKLATRSDSMKKKLNSQLSAKNTEIEETIKKLKSEQESAIERINADHQAEVARLREGAQPAAVGDGQSNVEDLNVSTGGTASEQVAHVKVEGNPTSEWTSQQVRDWISGNVVAKKILDANISRRVKDGLEKAVAEAKAQAKAEQETSIADTVKQKVEEATSLVRDEQEKKIEEIKVKVKEEQEKRFAVKFSMNENKLRQEKAKTEVVERAATETPQRPVVEVWGEAKVARPKPAAQAPKPTPPAQTTPSTQAGQSSIQSQQPVQPQTSSTPTTTAQPSEGGQSTQPQSGAAAPPQQSAASGIPQPNGATTAAFGQSPFGQPSVGQPGQGVQTGTFGQPSFAQPGQTGNQQFQQYGQNMNQNRFPQMGNPGGQPFGGFSGLAQPGFMGAQNPMQQGNANNVRPISPFNQPQQQQLQQPQAGRGRGQDPGTGPGALRNLAGHQGGTTSIPRGGGIPRPGGRGQANQQTQPNQNQGGNQPGGGQGASHIGRGGGRGRGGRGGAQVNTSAPGGSQAQGQGQGQGQGQNSPRTLNPGAAGFQPGAGRGQKRGREDGGDGSEGGHQAGKRPRGGAGRGGGAE